MKLLRKHALWIAFVAIATSAQSCKTNGYITSHVGTIVGIDISENPKTQVPHARFGFARTGMYYVPTGKTGTTEGGDASQTPTVVSEIFVDSKFMKSTTISEKFAIGTGAVTSSAANAAFLGNGAQQVAASNGAAPSSVTPNPVVAIPQGQEISINPNELAILDEKIRERDRIQAVVRTAIAAYNQLLATAKEKGAPVDFAAIQSKAEGVTINASDQEKARSSIQLAKTADLAQAAKLECETQLQKINSTVSN